VVLDGTDVRKSAQLAAVAGTHTVPTVTEAYVAQLFHGKAFEALASIDALAPDAISVTANPTPAPRAWFTRPLRGSWLAEPLALDAAFQALILWARAERHMPCLPCAVGRLTLTGARFPKDGVRVTLSVKSAGAALAIADVEFTDAAGALVARMDGVECVLDAALDASFRARTLSPAGAS
jgi:hypothetical protein